MPSIQTVQALAANQRGFNPLANWQYQYAPFDGLVRMGINCTGATVAGVLVSIFAGSDNVVQQGSPVSNGATAGVMPAPLNVPFFEFVVRSGDRITVAIDETAGLTPTVNFHCSIDPLPGR